MLCTFFLLLKVFSSVSMEFPLDGNSPKITFYKMVTFGGFAVNLKRKGKAACRPDAAVNLQSPDDRK